MDSVIYGVFTVLYMVLFGYGAVLWKRDSGHGLRYLLFVVTAGLIWDNGVMALGAWIGEGERLEGLNMARYWLHAFCTPLLALVSFDLMRRAGSGWTRKPAAEWGVWIFTAALIVLELTTETLGLQIKPVSEYGALRYVPVEEGSGPPLMVILILIPLFAAGFVLWRRKVTSVLLWGTLLMLAGSAVPLPVESAATTNLFELALLASLWLSVRKLIR